MSDDLGECGLEFGDVGFYFAPNEECASATGERADDRPVADFGFGEKDLRLDGGEDDDVEIAEVIAREEALCGRRAAPREFDVEEADVGFGPAMAPGRALLQSRIAAMIGESARSNGEEAD